MHAFGFYLLQVLLFFSSVFLILLVLVQRGRGGGLVGALGGAGGQSAFGSKAGDLFTRVTVVVAIIWILFSMLTIQFFNPPPRPVRSDDGFTAPGTAGALEDQDTDGLDFDANEQGIAPDEIGDDQKLDTPVESQPNPSGDGAFDFGTGDANQAEQADDKKDAEASDDSEQAGGEESNAGEGQDDTDDEGLVASEPINGGILVLAWELSAC
ncbi:MAG TPA: preprotein translocase subunit SecG [Pirellulaceae bacterium]|nr:preprotein translocase subunit SecG [Pirellulaceae bacterium]HMO91097.1 preprotein translocase subunit SecG [Pirellulaceae bacterium]HMP70555.1 preprotein translocase subunit SecG [Pirellulaceae bacterium]